MKISWYTEAEGPQNDSERELFDGVEQSLVNADAEGVSSQRIAELTLHALAMNGHDQA